MYYNLSTSDINFITSYQFPFFLKTRLAIVFN